MNEFPLHRRWHQGHPDFEEKYRNNPDVHDRPPAFEKIFDDVMLRARRTEIELYKLIANDAAFKAAMQEGLRRVVGA